MQPTTWFNVVRAATNYRKFLVMSDKVLKRIIGARGGLSTEENLSWLRANCQEFAPIAERIDPEIWREAKEFAESAAEHSRAILSSISFELGGGGFYPLLYFLTRRLQPKVVVETGVAAGFSSFACLAALDKNGAGRLLSSDFPYFRLPNPKRFIGIVVPEKLRSRWCLFVEGDENNLPKILSQVSAVDLFHYDSDKTYSGRQFAIELISKRLASHGVIVMDDIQDNSFFHDLVTTLKSGTPWYVFYFEGKYVGVVGSIQ